MNGDGEWGERRRRGGAVNKRWNSGEAARSTFHLLEKARRSDFVPAQGGGYSIDLGLEGEGIGNGYSDGRRK
jgi:hypothetical protein